MVSTAKIILVLLIIVLIDLAQARLSEVPPPPKRPERFHSREELKRYLQKVHEYHSILGRWRLRRFNPEHSLVPLAKTTQEAFGTKHQRNHLPALHHV